MCVYAKRDSLFSLWNGETPQNREEKLGGFSYEEIEVLVAKKRGVHLTYHMPDRENLTYHVHRVITKVNCMVTVGEVCPQPLPKLLGFVVTVKRVPDGANTASNGGELEVFVDPDTTTIDDLEVVCVKPKVGPGTDPKNLFGEGKEKARALQKSVDAVIIADSTSWRLCGRCKQNVHSKDVSCDKACDKCLHAEHSGSVCDECRATGIPGKAKCNARCAIPVCRHRGNRASHRKNGCGECDPGKGCNAIAAGARNDASVNTGDSIVIPGGGDGTGDSRNGGVDAIEADETLETLSNFCAIAEQSGDVDFSLLIEQIEDTGTPEELSSTVAIELADMVRAEEAVAE